jgi:hypothetical protein
LWRASDRRLKKEEQLLAPHEHYAHHHQCRVYSTSAKVPVGSIVLLSAGQRLPVSSMSQRLAYLRKHHREWICRLEHRLGPGAAHILTKPMGRQAGGIHQKDRRATESGQEGCRQSGALACSGTVIPCEPGWACRNGFPRVQDVFSAQVVAAVLCCTRNLECFYHSRQL